MAQHTPGPWKFGDPEDDPKAFRKILGGGMRQLNIAQVVQRQSQQEEDVANARLIGAAPEMYAALVDLVEQVAAYEHLHGEDTCPIDPDGAEGVIAKVKGE